MRKAAILLLLAEGFGFVSTPPAVCRAGAGVNACGQSCVTHPTYVYYV